MIKPVPQLNNLLVDDSGNVYQEYHETITADGRCYHHKAKQLNATLCDGYLRITFHNKSYSVHRLVASAFLPNPEDKETVNHIDGNKQNNCLSNLEWATQAENNAHARRLGLNVPLPRSVLQQHAARGTARIKVPIYCVEDNIIFESVTAARRYYGLGNSTIQDAIRKYNGYVSKINKTFAQVVEWHTRTP